MRYVLPFCILFVGAVLCNAQRVETFQRSYGGSKNDFGTTVIRLPNGDFIISGISNSYSSNGNNDILIIRTDSLGNVKWSKTFGGSSDEGTPPIFLAYDLDMVLTADNKGIAVCSSTKSYGSGVSSGNPNVYFFKIDFNGNTRWSHTYGGSSGDFGTNVIVDPNGGFMITGLTNSYGPGNGDVLLIKTDTAGSIIWSKAYGSSSNTEAGMSISPTQNGNFIIAGYTNTSQNEYDQMVMSVDKNGKLLWNKDYGTSNYDIGFSPIELPDRSLYLSGITYNQYNGENTVATVSKLDSTGKLTWTKIYDKNQHSGANKIMYDKSKKMLNLAYSTFVNGYQRIGFLRLDTSGNVRISRYFAPDPTTSYSGGFGHPIATIPSGGFAILLAGQQFGFGGWDYYLVRTDSAVNTHSCLGTDLSLSPFDYTSNLTNNTYSFTTASITPSAGSGISESTVTVGDSLHCSPFVAAFGFNNACAGKQVQFMDSSYIKAKTWAWNFGDNSSPSNTSTSQNPTHTYSTGGNYSVSLTASDGSRADVTTHVITIYPLPNIAPWAQNINNYAVSFTPQDTTIGNFKWYYGDPDSSGSSSKEPTFTYPSKRGKYLVKLYVTNKYGCVSEKTDSVIITYSGIEQQVNDLKGIQVFPNPFEGVTHINYKLQSRSMVNINVFDLAGKQVAQLKNGFYEAGQYSDIFDAAKCHCPDGMYILKMTVNDRVYTTRVENLR